jgi:hypothetical protein
VSEPLVNAEALVDLAQGLSIGTPPGLDRDDWFADNAQAAEDYVRAYCTRGIPEPAPPVVSRVATALALRLCRNPLALRGVSVDGQSADLPMIGLTFFETVLLNRWRRRTA